MPEMTIDAALARCEELIGYWERAKAPENASALRVLVAAVRRFKRLHDDIATSSERAPLPSAPGATEGR